VRSLTPVVAQGSSRPSQPASPASPMRDFRPEPRWNVYTCQQTPELAVRGVCRTDVAYGGSVSCEIVPVVLKEPIQRDSALGLHDMGSAASFVEMGHRRHTLSPQLSQRRLPRTPSPKTRAGCSSGPPPRWTATGFHPPPHALAHSHSPQPRHSTRFRSLNTHASYTPHMVAGVVERAVSRASCSQPQHKQQQQQQRANAPSMGVVEGMRLSSTAHGYSPGASAGNSILVASGGTASSAPMVVRGGCGFPFSVNGPPPCSGTTAPVFTSGRNVPLSGDGQEGLVTPWRSPPTEPRDAVGSRHVTPMQEHTPSMCLSVPQTRHKARTVISPLAQGASKSSTSPLSEPYLKRGGVVSPQPGAVSWQFGGAIGQTPPVTHAS